MRALPVVSVLPMILRIPMHMLGACPPKSDWFFQFVLLSVDDKKYYSLVGILKLHVTASKRLKLIRTLGLILLY
jgi:hypothetical protein